MDLSAFPLPSLVAISGPEVPALRFDSSLGFVPEPGQDCTSWWVQVSQECTVAIPAEVAASAASMAAHGRLFRWNQGERWDDSMEDTRQRLNRAAEELRSRAAT